MVGKQPIPTISERQQAKILIHHARFGVGVRIEDFPYDLRKAVKVELDILVDKGMYEPPSPTSQGMYITSYKWHGYSGEDFV